MCTYASRLQPYAVSVMYCKASSKQGICLIINGSVMKSSPWSSCPDVLMLFDRQQLAVILAVFLEPDILTSDLFVRFHRKISMSNQ
jgi:hypothetical protein